MMSITCAHGAAVARTQAAKTRCAHTEQTRLSGEKAEFEGIMVTQLDTRKKDTQTRAQLAVTLFHPLLIGVIWSGPSRGVPFWVGPTSCRRYCILLPQLSWNHLGIRTDDVVKCAILENEQLRRY